MDMLTNDELFDELLNDLSEVTDEGNLTLITGSLGCAESCETLEDFDANLTEAISALDAMRVGLMTLRTKATRAIAKAKKASKS
jgi:hypothetical protein